MKGHCLEYGRGTARDLIAGTQFHIVAADNGSAHACFRVAERYRLGKHGLPQDYHLAALYYLRATSLGRDCSDDVAALKRDHPMEVAPWTRWQPTAEVHSLVPENVHSAMLTWLLISKRSPVPRDLAPMITRYINTRNGW